MKELIKKIENDGFDIFENRSNVLVYGKIELDSIKSIEDVDNYNYSIDVWEEDYGYSQTDYTILKNGEPLWKIKEEWFKYDNCSLEEVKNFFKEYYKEVK